MFSARVRIKNLNSMNLGEIENSDKIFSLLLNGTEAAFTDDLVMILAGKSTTKATSGTRTALVPIVVFKFTLPIFRTVATNKKFFFFFSRFFFKRNFPRFEKLKKNYNKKIKTEI